MWLQQWFFFRQNIGHVTPKNVDFHYLKKYFLDQSIWQIFNLILKTAALDTVFSSFRCTMFDAECMCRLYLRCSSNSSQRLSTTTLFPNMCAITTPNALLAVFLFPKLKQKKHISDTLIHCFFNDDVNIYFSGWPNQPAWNGSSPWVVLCS